MVAQVIVTPSDGLLDAVGLVVLEVIVQLLQPELELLVPGVDPAEVEGGDGPLPDALVRHVRQVTSSSSSSAIGGPGHSVGQLAVESLVESGVVSVLTVTETNIDMKSLSTLSLSSPDGQLQGLHCVHRAVLRNELETVELGEAGVGVAGDLQVQAGVLHHVVQLLLQGEE